MRAAEAYVTDHQNNWFRRPHNFGETHEGLAHTRAVMEECPCALRLHQLHARQPAARYLGAVVFVYICGLTLAKPIVSKIPRFNFSALCDCSRKTQPEHLKRVSAIIIDCSQVRRRGDHAVNNPGSSHTQMAHVGACAPSQYSRRTLIPEAAHGLNRLS